MKWKEWVILAVLIVGVAALEVFGGESEPSPHGDSPQATTRAAAGTPADRLPPSGSTAEPRGPFRTVELHVTGMT